MKHGSLFSGIGGFDLAAEWMGWENEFHCEWNPFGRKVLKYYFKEAKSYEDITKTDFTIWRNRIDVLTGGFPCQPYSQAGHRLGTDDDRHLWPEMLRAIGEIQPTWVVGENVYGIVNWSGGLVFEEVQVDLEDAGYEVQAYILPASSVNAPHQRNRVWFIAYSDRYAKRRASRQLRETSEEKRISERDEMGKPCGSDEARISTTNTNDSGASNLVQPDGIGKKKDNGRGGFSQPEPGEDGIDGDATNTKHIRLENDGIGDFYEESGTFTKQQFEELRYSKYRWEKFPIEPGLCDGNDGISARLDGITFSKWRNESVKAGGNAVVPQLVYQLFKTIEDYEQNIIQRNKGKD